MEVTRAVPQTIVVTKVITQTVIATQSIPITAVPARGTIISPVQTIQTDRETIYYRGIATIAQYYTLLDQGLYEKAYGLLSPSMPHIKDLEEYTLGAKMTFEEVKIVAIRPFDEWAEQQGHSVPKDQKNQMRFFIQIIAEGEGLMSGSVMSGDVQTLFVTLVLENGERKIYTINTSP